MEKQKKSNGVKGAIILFAILLILDQVSKIMAIGANVDMPVIGDFLHFKLVLNNGGVFGIGQGRNPLTFIIPDLIVLGIIIRFIYLQKDRMDQVTMGALFAVLAGGIGNMLDRIFRGAVVDFIAVLPANNLPVMNLSDIYINIGWVILAFMFASYTYKEIKERKKIKE